MALVTAIVLPAATTVWISRERTAAEANYAQLQANLDGAGVVQRELIINGKTFYEKCVQGWCTKSRAVEDLEDFNLLPPSSRAIGQPTGGGFTVVDLNSIELELRNKD